MTKPPGLAGELFLLGVSCPSPWRFRVGKGVYNIRLRAVGVTGLRGPVALKRFWTGKRCRRHTCLTGGGELN